jgi:hypothetical protein
MITITISEYCRLIGKNPRYYQQQARYIYEGNKPETWGQRMPGVIRVERITDVLGRYIYTLIVDRDAFIDHYKLDKNIEINELHVVNSL